jgi:hypothetical protein
MAKKKKIIKKLKKVSKSKTKRKVIKKVAAKKASKPQNKIEKSVPSKPKPRHYIKISNFSIEREVLETRKKLFQLFLNQLKVSNDPEAQTKPMLFNDEWWLYPDGILEKKK